MDFKLHIDSEHKEEVIVYAHAESEFTDAIKRMCDENRLQLIGIKDTEGVILNALDVDCFIVENNKIFAITDKGKYQMKCRLYQLEQQLNEGFVKINQSCIANIKQIERFDAAYSGSLMVRFKNGYSDYVSRRNLKNVKERLGIKK
ncbi:MAG: LytTR family transcriptional regulator DNA-binding domain-containing protein [Clostridia bacterium]|nr:LytTR family transcriptional regulator DNA-binding domain-containing protein [Clostridia bacterium]